MFRRFFIIAICLACTACGFHPVYGVNKYQSTGVETHLAATNIDTIPDFEGRFLRNLLIDRFHRQGAQGAQYILNIKPITESVRNLDITKTSDSTRAQLQLTTSMSLTDIDGKILMSQNLNAIVSYNILASEFSTRVSEKNAQENGLHELAEQIETRVSLYFKRASAP